MPLPGESGGEMPFSSGTGHSLAKVLDFEAPTLFGGSLNDSAGAVVGDTTSVGPEASVMSVCDGLASSICQSVCTDVYLCRCDDATMRIIVVAEVRS